MSKSLWAAIFLLAGTMIHMPGAYAQTIGFADAIKILNSSCGEDIEKWAGVVSVSAEELSGGFYSLCGRKRCFRDVSGCCEGLRASRARSGHGDALPILTHDAT